MSQGIFKPGFISTDLCVPSNLQTRFHLDRTLVSQGIFKPGFISTGPSCPKEFLNPKFHLYRALGILKPGFISVERQFIHDADTQYIHIANIYYMCTLLLNYNCCHPTHIFICSDRLNSNSTVAVARPATSSPLK